MNTQDPSPRPRGRPTDETLGPVIVQALMTVLAEEGYAGLSTAKVARRAGVSTATMYRRWPSKRDLVLAAAEQIEQGHEVDTDTGSLRGDLNLYLSRKSEVLSGEVAAVVVSLMGEATHDVELGDVLRASVFTPTARQLQEIYERAAAREEIDDLPDSEASAQLIIGSILSASAFGSPDALLNPDKRGLLLHALTPSPEGHSP